VEERNFIERALEIAAPVAKPRQPAASDGSAVKNNLKQAT
jgi:hypothetical protein